MFISGIDPWPWALVLSGNLRHITGGRLVL